MILKIFFGTVLALTGAGCERVPESESAPKPPSLSRATPVRTSCPALQSADYFFPSGTISTGHAGIDARKVQWYSAQLSAMQQPSLSCGPGEDSYRFTWLRTFDHPVSVRVDANRATGEYTLNAIELDSAGGYAPGAEKRNLTRVLSSSEAAKLTQMLDVQGFWALPSNDNEEGFGTDGSEWILESREGNRYHFVTRWSPDDGPTRHLGLMFILLSGWEFQEVY